MKYLMFALAITLSGCADRYDVEKTRETLNKITCVNQQNTIHFNCTTDVIGSLAGNTARQRQTIRTFLGLPKNYPLTHELFEAYWDAYMYRCKEKARKLERDKL